MIQTRLGPLTSASDGTKKTKTETPPRNVRTGMLINNNSGPAPEVALCQASQPAGFRGHRRQQVACGIVPRAATLSLRLFLCSLCQCCKPTSASDSTECKGSALISSTEYLALCLELPAKTCALLDLPHVTNWMKRASSVNFAPLVAIQPAAAKREEKETTCISQPGRSSESRSHWRQSTASVHIL